MRPVAFSVHLPPALAGSLLLPAEDDRRASLARDRWRVLEAEQQQLGGGGGGAAGEAAAAADGGDGAGQHSNGSAQHGGQLRLYPEAELVVEPEQEGSDDDGAGRDEHVRQLVQAYRQQGEQVGRCTRGSHGPAFPPGLGAG